MEQKKSKFYRLYLQLAVEGESGGIVPGESGARVRSESGGRVPGERLGREKSPTVSFSHCEERQYQVLTLVKHP